jgi:hypothetical protein
MSLGKIAILLGSGFSILEGLPSLNDINNKLSIIKEGDFYLLSDQTARFYYSDWKDPNGWMQNSFLDRLFVEEFTSFYCAEYLNNVRESYNYEKSYDFISDFIRFKIEKEKIDTFCEVFNSKIKSAVYQQNSYSWVWRLKEF